MKWLGCKEIKGERTELKQDCLDIKDIFEPEGGFVVGIIDYSGCKSV